MLAAEIASTTAKPSMILERNRRVGSLIDEPRPGIPTSTPRFHSEKQASGGPPPPGALRKLKAEWIKVRKCRQKLQAGGRCFSLTLPWRGPRRAKLARGSVSHGAKRNAKRGGVISPLGHRWMWRDPSPH